MDTGSILGDDAVFIGFSLAQVGDSEVVLSDGGVVALEPAIVVPLICAVDFPFHHVTDDLASTIIEWHSPAQ